MSTPYLLKCSVIYILTLCAWICFGQCPNGGLATFAKMSSVIPRTSTQPVLLYATSRGTAITAECYNRCQDSDDCAGFIVDYERASCFRIPLSDMVANEYTPAKNSNFFFKVCLQVPSNCMKKAWPIEFAPNSELIGYQQHVIPNVADQWQCAQYCLTGTTQYRYGQTAPCASAQYQHWSKTCTLSSETRRTKPEAFNPGIEDGVDYIENMCISEVKVDNVGCWHEPIYNQTLVEIDLQIPNINIDQCRERCEKEEYFNCRGFTYKCASSSQYVGDSVCYLHSDDTLIAGPLVPASCTTYVERLPCFDLKVACSATSMAITLNYKHFEGRMFVVGYADECGVSGHNQDVTTLVLPITIDPRALNRCGIFVAHSVGYGNRKLATVIIVVQRHPIIQTLGDRVVKVTCIAEDSTDRLPRPLFNNITLDASFGVAEPSVQTSIVNEVPNATNVSPTARLRILDLGRGGAEASETVLGEELELRIDIYPPFNASVLRAGHLVASSGDERDSLLLLDWRGCPPDPSTFPALTAKAPNVLSAVFKAFRFPSSPILKFSLILTICDDICQPTDCGNGLTSWGKRKKRSIEEDGNTQEVPLRLTIIVRSPDQDSDALNTTEIASLYSVSEFDETVCVSWPTIITLLLLFGILQIIILAVYCFCFQGRKQKFNDQVSLNNDFQPRHVTWADQ
ncbi:hypothetical protein PGB90_002461 [Kerria lacca]